MSEQEKKEPRMSNTEQRLDKLEIIVEKLVEGQNKLEHQLEQAFSTLTESFESYRKESLAEINDVVKQVNQPKWPLVITLLSLMLTIFMALGGITAFVLSGQSHNMDSNTHKIETLQKDMTDVKVKMASLHGCIECSGSDVSP